MAKARCCYNVKCIRCHVIEEEMTMIGPIHFCNSCASAEFTMLVDPVDGHIDMSTGMYQKWLNIYKESLDV